MEKVLADEIHKRFRAQGVGSREHIAFKCPVCATVQSMASLVKAGTPTDKVENYVGFSCEGRFNNAGPWPSGKDKTKKANERRMVRGCDWTLGGFFKLHKLEVTTPDGKVHPTFEVASSDEAKSLQATLSDDVAA